MKTVKEVLITLYSEILESYSNKNELYRLRNSMTFYEFIEKQLEKYRKLCGEIKEEELVQISRGEFKCECTQKRFMNMINRLIDAHLQILRFAYEGDYYTSFCQLENLMLSKGKLTQYMNDEYQSYIIGDVNKKILYRMRDISQNENPPESCWHVPFSNRNRASLGRYNMSGIPCLYLADSKETSDKELGVLKDGKNRWCSEFNSEKGFIVVR